MRALGLSDTIFYNLRDAQITTVAALDGPCDLARLVAGIDGVTDALPGFRETPLRLGVWSFASAPAAIDLRRHVAVATDATVTSREHLTPLLDRLRRNRIAAGGPPWRIIVLNPAVSGTSSPGFPAVFMQMRHGLADAARTFQAIARLGDYEPTATHAAMARQLPAFSFGGLTRDIAVPDSGMLTLAVPRSAISRSGNAGERFAAAVLAAVEDDRLFPGARPLHGALGRTRLVSRRAGDSGNHIRMETVRRAAEPASPRFRIPGLARAQELPVSQWAVAVSPGPVARMMMRVWYSGFDAIATLIPLPRRLGLGGRNVTAFFAAPPLWGPVPLMALALAGNENYFITLFPGRGFSGDTAMLLAEMRRLLSRGTSASAASPAP